MVCVGIHWVLWFCITVSHQGRLQASGTCANLKRKNVLTALLQPALFRNAANRFSRHLAPGQEQVKRTAMADRGLAHRNELDVKAIMVMGRSLPGTCQ